MRSIVEEARLVLEKAFSVLEAYPLCDRCLGRMFALLGRGWSNLERGQAIKRLILMSLHARIRDGDEEAVKMLRRIAANVGPLASKLYSDVVGGVFEPLPCYICGSRLDSFVREAAERIVKLLDEYDASTYLLAARVSEDVRSREEEIKVRFGLAYAEGLGAEIKREVSKLVQSMSNRKPDFNYPDVVVEMRFPSGEIIVHPMPILLAGVYWKLGRRVSQSIWVTRSGRKYPFSVEDAYKPLVRLYEAERVVVHAAGREDVDVRMLGTGRPVIVEVKKPLRRRISPRDASEAVNNYAKGLVETLLERSATRSDVYKLKDEAAEHHKIYRALVVASREVGEEELRRLEDYFTGRVIRQRTPRRVRHRRADVVRVKRVYRVAATRLAANVFECLIECEGGLYVKELIDGDGGDTTPSFAELLGTELYCAELDVVAVEPLITPTR